MEEGPMKLLRVLSLAVRNFAWMLCMAQLCRERGLYSDNDYYSHDFG